MKSEIPIKQSVELDNSSIRLSTENASSVPLYLRKLTHKCHSTPYLEYEASQFKSCWPAGFVDTGTRHMQQLHR